MATKKVRATEDGQYKDFLRSLDLVTVGLKSCSTSIDREAYFALRGRKSKALYTFEADYRLKRTTAEFFEAEGEFELTVSDSAKPTPAVRIDFALEVHVHSKPPIKKEFAQRFTEAGLGAVLLPYARSFVTDITARMNIPPVFVPLSIGTRASHSPKKGT